MKLAMHDLYKLNDLLAAFIADRGLVIDDDTLNDLTNDVAASIEASLTASTVDPNAEETPA